MAGAAAQARDAMLGMGEDDEQEAADAGLVELGDEGEETDPYEELSLALQAEREGALGTEGDTLANDQVAAFERYLGLDYGDEQVGQSRVHTREVFETIEWMRPNIARIFTAGDKTIMVSPWVEGEDGINMAEEATDYLNYVLFQECDGLAIIDSFFFDGAVQKVGFLAATWDDEELGPPEELEGVDIYQAQALEADEKNELLEVEPDSDETFRIRLQRVKKPARPSLDAIAPEDFRCSKRTTSLERPSYCGHTIWTSKSQLRQMFPEKHAEIEEYADSARGWESDERRQLRFDLDEEVSETARSAREDGNDVALEREFIFFDLDGDGYDELLECFSIGTCVLEAEPVEDNIYGGWSPIRIPHKLVGMSMAEVVMDIQRIQTVLTRTAMNASLLSVAPRVAAHEDKVNLTDLLTVRAGALIRFKGSEKAEDVIRPIVTPDTSAATLKMMDRFDLVRQSRTGVTSHSQGLNPDVLNKTMGGIELLQTAADEREELIARNLGAGLQAVVRKLWKLIVTNRKGPHKVYLPKRKEWKTFDPSQWDENAQVTVDVGQGAGNVRVRLAQLQWLLGLQMQVIDKFGLDNPFVTLSQVHNTIEQITRLMGYRTADAFFTDPKTIAPEKLQAMLQPKPDPKLQAEMQKMQLSQQEQNNKMQAQILELQQRGQLKREELAQEGQLAREQMQTEADLSMHETLVNAAAKSRNEPAPIPRKTQVGGDKI